MASVQDCAGSVSADCFALRLGGAFLATVPALLRLAPRAGFAGRTMLPTGTLRALPAIALTAFASPIDREKALAAGFQRHLSKPVEPVELAKIVARVLGRSEEGITL